MRLLQCFDCRTVDEVPDFNGRPEDDTLLQYVIDTKHPKLGGVEDHRGALHHIDDKKYREYRTDILREMWSKTSGHDQEFDDARSTFYEDAGKCWAIEHNRPTFCGDFKLEKKRLRNPTKEGRRSQDPRMKVFLCDFCIVRTNIMSAENLADKRFD